MKRKENKQTMQDAKIIRNERIVLFAFVVFSLVTFLPLIFKAVQSPRMKAPMKQQIEYRIEPQEEPQEELQEELPEGPQEGPQMELQEELQEEQQERRQMELQNEPQEEVLSRPRSRWSLKQNLGQGDCLFYCYKQLMESERDYSIAELRGIVQDSITETNLDFLMTLYKDAKHESDNELLRDYGFMATVTTLDELKNIVGTRAYFGDDMALEALDEALNVNVLVVTFSSNGTMRIADRLKKKTKFEESKRFGIFVLNDIHYELLIYGNLSLMTYNELPMKIKTAMTEEKLSDVDLGTDIELHSSDKIEDYELI